MQPKVFNFYSQQRGEKLLKDQTSRNVIKPPKTNNNKDKTQRKKKLRRTRPSYLARSVFKLKCDAKQIN